jgi:hypothetical protein
MTVAPAEKPCSAVAWTSKIIAVAAVTLLLTNPASLKGWIAQQRPEAVPPMARAAVDGWWNITEGLGLTTPRTAIERIWRGAQAAEWPQGKPS